MTEHEIARIVVVLIGGFFQLAGVALGLVIGIRLSLHRWPWEGK